MTTGPRNTPHPIILHVDAQGNPVRLAEASSIYVTAVSAVSISATNYLGLGGDGRPEGIEGSIQFKSNNGFGGVEEFKYDDTNGIIIVPAINSDSVSSDYVNVIVVSSTNLSSINIRATSISATTVCATNYDTLLNALSFQNLDNRYLNSSGDSVTGSIYIQNLSATNLSATNWLGLPSSLATWNASAIQGIAVTSTQPTLGQSLVYKDGIWQPSSIAGVGGGSPDGDELSIQFRNGSFFSGVGSIKYNNSINGIQSIGLSSTNLSSINLRVVALSGATVCATVVSAASYANLGEDTAQWNANRFQGTLFSKGSLANDDIISYDADNSLWKNRTKEFVAGTLSPQLHTETWNASSLRGVTVTSTSPTTGNVLRYTGSVWAPSGDISLNNITAVNLGGTNIVGSNATVTTVSSTNLSSTNARITGLSAATVSAATYQNIFLSSMLDTTGMASVSGAQALVYSSSVSRWQPGYRIYQNTSQPNTSVGSNGDIYFQILDSTGTALSSLIDTSIVNPTNGQSLIWSSSISRWIPGAAVESVGNASAIRGEPIIAKEAANNETTLGALFHIYAIDKYQTVPLNSSSINGTRNVYSITTNESQGAVVASYLGSASEYFQINPYWNSPDLTSLAQGFFGVTSNYEYPDLPQDKDVLVFTENLYNKQFAFTGIFDPEDKAWTWQRLSLGGNYLLDVDTSTASLNQVLTYNGNQWVNSSNLTQVTALGSYIASADLSSVKLTKYYESKTQPTISASSLTLNLNNSQIFDVTLNSNVTSINIQNPINANETAQGFTLAITYDSTPRTITWPASIKWPGGTSPVLTNTVDKIDIFSFVTLNKGSSWLGFISGQNYSA